MTSSLRRILLALAVGLSALLAPAAASAAVHDVRGNGPVVLAGDRVLHGREAAGHVASDTWIGEAVNVSEICCKAADTMPIRAGVDVRRIDGSGGRRLAFCARGRSAVLALRGSTAVYAVDCPDEPKTALMAVDLDAGTAPRVLVEDVGSILEVRMSATQVAYSAFGPNGRAAYVLDLATGAPVRTAVLPPGAGIAGLLDHGTLVLAHGVVSAACDMPLQLLRPNGTLVTLGTTCMAPAVFGERLAYLRAGADEGLRELVVRDTGIDRVAAVVHATAPLAGLDLDARRVAWVTERCSDGMRVIAVDLAGDDPVVGPGPAHCPWSVAREAAATRGGPLVLTVRCPLGCDDLVHVAARGRTVALEHVSVAPDEQVLELSMRRWARRALARDGQLRVRVHAGRQLRPTRVTVRMAG